MSQREKMSHAHPAKIKARMNNRAITSRPIALAATRYSGGRLNRLLVHDSSSEEEEEEEEVDDNNGSADDDDDSDTETSPEPQEVPLPASTHQPQLVFYSPQYTPTVPDPAPLHQNSIYLQPMYSSTAPADEDSRSDKAVNGTPFRAVLAQRDTRDRHPLARHGALHEQFLLRGGIAPLSERIKASFAPARALPRQPVLAPPPVPALRAAPVPGVANVRDPSTTVGSVLAKALGRAGPQAAFRDPRDDPRHARDSKPTQWRADAVLPSARAPPLPQRASTSRDELGQDHPRDGLGPPQPAQRTQRRNTSFGHNAHAHVLEPRTPVNEYDRDAMVAQIIEERAGERVVTVDGEPDKNFSLAPMVSADAHATPRQPRPRKAFHSAPGGKKAHPPSEGSFPRWEDTLLDDVDADADADADARHAPKVSASADSLPQLPMGTSVALLTALNTLSNVAVPPPHSPAASPARTRARPARTPSRQPRALESAAAGPGLAVAASTVSPPRQHPVSPRAASPVAPAARPPRPTMVDSFTSPTLPQPTRKSATTSTSPLHAHAPQLADAPAPRSPTAIAVAAHARAVLPSAVANVEDNTAGSQYVAAENTPFPTRERPPASPVDLDSTLSPPTLQRHALQMLREAAKRRAAVSAKPVSAPAHEQLPPLPAPAVPPTIAAQLRALPAKTMPPVTSPFRHAGTGTAVAGRGMGSHAERSPTRRPLVPATPPTLGFTGSPIRAPRNARQSLLLDHALPSPHPAAAESGAGNGDRDVPGTPSQPPRATTHTPAMSDVPNSQQIEPVSPQLPRSPLGGSLMVVDTRVASSPRRQWHPHATGAARADEDSENDDDRSAANASVALTREERRAAFLHHGLQDLSDTSDDEDGIPSAAPAAPAAGPSIATELTPQPTPSRRNVTFSPMFVCDDGAVGPVADSGDVQQGEDGTSATWRSTQASPGGYSGYAASATAHGEAQEEDSRLPVCNLSSILEETDSGAEVADDDDYHTDHTRAASHYVTTTASAQHDGTPPSAPLLTAERTPGDAGNTGDARTMVAGNVSISGDGGDGDGDGDGDGAEYEAYEPGASEEQQSDTSFDYSAELIPELQDQAPPSRKRQRGNKTADVGHRRGTIFRVGGELLDLEHEDPQGPRRSKRARVPAEEWWKLHARYGRIDEPTDAIVPAVLAYEPYSEPTPRKPARPPATTRGKKATKAGGAVSARALRAAVQDALMQRDLRGERGVTLLVSTDGEGSQEDAPPRDIQRVFPVEVTDKTGRTRKVERQCVKTRGELAYGRLVQSAEDEGAVPDELPFVAQGFKSSSHMSGVLVLPPGVVKSGEKAVADEVFYVDTCAFDHLQLNINGVNTKLSGGDIVRIPKGNVYALANRSTSDVAKLFYVIVKE